jgi:hypothetical protein
MSKGLYRKSRKQVAYSLERYDRAIRDSAPNYYDRERASTLQRCGGGYRVIRKALGNN